MYSSLCHIIHRDGSSISVSRPLDSFSQHPKKGPLLLRLSIKRLAFVAALRAEFVQLASGPSQFVDACIAHHFEAVGALMGGAHRGMPRAHETSVNQCYRRNRTFIGQVKLRNGDLDFHFLHFELYITQSECFTDREPRFNHSFASHECALCRLAIAQDEFAFPQFYFTMAR